MMKRIPESLHVSVNHFGVLMELSNQEKYLIHNSPSNKGNLGNEIIIHESQMIPNKWELHTKSIKVNQEVTIDEIIRPVSYRMLSTNCITSVERVWQSLNPPVEFDIFLDPKTGKTRQPSKLNFLWQEETYSNLLARMNRSMNHSKIASFQKISNFSKNPTNRMPVLTIISGSLLLGYRAKYFKSEQ